MAQKELMLNYACSLMLPMDDDLKDVFRDVWETVKIPMTVAVGKEMTSELKPYDFDMEKLGMQENDEAAENVFDT